MKLRGSHLTTITLVAVAAALGGYVFLVDRNAPTSAQLSEREHNLFKVFRLQDLTEVTLQSPASTTRIARSLTADSGDDAYTLETGSPPVKQRGDAAAIERLFETLDNATPARKVDRSADRSQMGLDPPRLRMSIQMGKTTFQLSIGGQAPSPTGAVFVEMQGDTYVLPREFANEVLKPVDAYRVRNLSPYVSAELATIQLEGVGGLRRLERADWGGFRIANAPGSPRAFRSVFEAMISAFGSLRAERFISDSAANAALAPPANRITLTLEPKDKQPRVRIELGGDCPDAADAGSGKLVVAIRHEPTRISSCVPSTAFDGLRSNLEAFTDRRLLDVRFDDFEEVLLQRGDQSLELARKGSGWHMRKPEDKDVPADTAKGWIHGLMEMEGEIIPSPDAKALGLDPPAGALTVRLPASGDQKHPEQRVTIGQRGPSGVVVRRDQDGVVLRFTSNQARLLLPTTTHIRSTDLVDISPDAVRRVNMVFGANKQSVARAPAGFVLEQPSGFQADGALSADLFEMVARLAADRWIADRDDGSFGLASPRATVQFEATMDGGAHVRKLLIGDLAQGGAYARFEPDTGVFLLSSKAETTLSSYVIDRSLFMVDPSETRQVSITTDQGNLVLSVDKAGEWQMATDAGPSLSPNAITSIRNALLEMRTEGVPHLGPPKDEEGFSKPTARIVVRRAPSTGDRAPDVILTIGRADVWRSMNVYWARRDGVAATFAIAGSRIKAILDPIGSR